MLRFSDAFLNWVIFNAQFVKKSVADFWSSNLASLSMRQKCVFKCFSFQTSGLTAPILSVDSIIEWMTTITTATDLSRQ